MLKFSTYEKAFEELLENEGLKKKAAKSGISYGTLKKVYNRGMAAWRTGHRPGTTPQQWGMARVNSYIGKGKGTYYGADSDLSGKGKKKKEAVGEAKVNELSKGKLGGYIKRASRDVFQKGRDDATQDAISKLGGKHKDQEYKKGPERKAAMRVRGIDRATKRLMQKGKNVSGLRNNENVKTEAMSDAEKKAHDAAIAAFKAKGGKVKKLKPGYAQGYHGKADPAAGMKGMMDKGDTKAFGTKKKIGSMK